MSPARPRREPPAPPERARDRLLFLLKTRGPQTAGQLAERLDVTPVAVRQHLAALEGEGLVSREAERRPVGRPAHVYRLEPAARERFPDAHAELTVELLGAVRRTLGEAALDRVVAARTRDQLRRYRERMPPKGARLDRRVAALARLRSDEGYMAEWSRERDGAFLLVENHCPICAAAAACQSLCRDELAVFRKVLGPGVRVERTDHVLAGARRCAYRIEPA